MAKGRLEPESLLMERAKSRRNHEDDGKDKVSNTASQAEKLVIERPVAAVFVSDFVERTPDETPCRRGVQRSSLLKDEQVVDSTDLNQKFVVARDLLTLLYATKARLENEHFFGSLSNADQAWALDLLDEMVPQVMELETNQSFALQDQIELHQTALQDGQYRLRRYLDHVGDQPGFFRATETFLEILDDLLTPVRGPCLP